MISKGYLYHLVWVKDSSLVNPSLDSVSMVCEFPEVFPKKIFPWFLPKGNSTLELISLEIPNLFLFLLKEWFKESISNSKIK